jgi:hypothetical protein
MSLVSDARNRAQPPDDRPIEHYVRASVDIALGSVEVGVQWFNPATRDIDRNTARAIIESVDDSLGASATADSLTDEIERRFILNWPDRGWFIEVWNKHEALTQVYAPCGMPRSA